jgi:hypothetical protein
VRLSAVPDPAARSKYTCAPPLKVSISSVEHPVNAAIAQIAADMVYLSVDMI